MLEWIASPLDPITHQDAFDPKNPCAAGNVIFYQSATAEAQAGIGYEPQVREIGTYIKATPDTHEAYHRFFR